MGTLTLPNSGTVYLDANGFIYSVEHIEPYSTLLKPLWLAAQQDQFEVISQVGWATRFTVAHQLHEEWWATKRRCPPYTNL